MSAPPPRPITIVMLAFDEMEVLDFAGPYEVFTTANRVWQRSHPQQPLFEVTTISRDGADVKARAGLRVGCDGDFSTPVHPGLTIIPGGVVDQAAQCPDTLAWVQRMHALNPRMASVCTGVFILAAAGLLKQQSVTTHWEDQTELKLRHSALNVQQDVQWVDDGLFTTSAGISAGIGMSLHLVAQLAAACELDGLALALRTAQQMEYPWSPNPRWQPPGACRTWGVDLQPTHPKSDRLLTPPHHGEVPCL